MEGRSFSGAFERRAKYLFIIRIFIEEFGRHLKEDCGNGRISPYVPPLGNLEGVCLPGPLIDR
jgi:hypothetical protein